MSVGCSAQRRRRPAGVKGQRSIGSNFSAKKNIFHKEFLQKKIVKGKKNMRSVFSRPITRAFSANVRKSLTSFPVKVNWIN